MKNFLAIITFMTFAGSSLLAGTGFDGVEAGKKVFELNDKVGQNKIQFLSDAPMEKIQGTADGVTGTFTMDASNLEATMGNLVVQVRAMKTAVSKRDNHMYGSEWLDADKFPTVEYKVLNLTNVTVSTKDGMMVANAIANGSFTIHGVTKKMMATVSITYLPESEKTKSRAPGNLAMITANFTVKLADFEIKGSTGTVGKAVGEEIAVEAKVFANSK